MTDEQQSARNMLATIFEKQPQLLQNASNAESGGRDLANFCKGFIEQYSAYLKTLPKS